MERVVEKEVPKSAPRWRIDRYLAGENLGISRSRIQSLILSGKVVVNGRPVKRHYPVRPGDKILVSIPQPTECRAEPEHIPLDILFEDEHLLVVNKPAGMVVHPASGNYSHTLVNALLYHCTDLSGINGVLRPGIVHRLDKDTSGLLVVAKNDRTHIGLAEQFENRTVGREYLAIVWGTPEPESGRIVAPIGRHFTDRKRMAVRPAGGREASTRYVVLERLGICSYLSLKPETGRTHQIRVHLSHSGYPILGDPKYGGRQKQAGRMPQAARSLAADLLGIIRRQALHAASIGLIHPAVGEWMEFRAPLPPDMAAVLVRLRAE